MLRALRWSGLTLLLAACAVSTESRPVPDGGVRGGGDGGGSPDGGAVMSCDPQTTLDLAGCSCDTVGAFHGCYPASADPSTRNLGACHDGKQYCMATGEFSGWGPCMGAVTPTTEQCHDGIDNDCNGMADCQDSRCATDSSCNTGCTDGETRPCYDGPSGTEGVGICHGGTQTCSGGKWPTTCPGEQTPQTEVCTDSLDHNCNHLAGCFDVFACASDSACVPHCDPNKLDPNCVCPTGDISADNATCPMGTYGLTTGNGIDPGEAECCPCTASDCSAQPNCCATSVCANDPSCAQYTCMALPSSCNGQVSFDCDDWPEDCDQTCCACYGSCM